MTSLFQHEGENSSTPVAAAAAGAAAGTVTGANVAATALAQQPFAEPLATAHTGAAEESIRTSHASQVDSTGQQPSNPIGMSSYPRNTTTLLCAISAIVVKQVLSHALVVTPSHYLTPCKRAAVLSHPMVYQTPFVAPATCTFSSGLHKIAHPPQMTTPRYIHFFLTPKCFHRGALSFVVYGNSFASIGWVSVLYCALFIGRTSNKTIA